MARTTYVITVRFKTMLDEKAMKSVRTDMEKILNMKIKQEKLNGSKRTCTWIVFHFGALEDIKEIKSKLPKILAQAGDSKADIDIKERGDRKEGSEDVDAKKHDKKEREKDRKKANSSSVDEDLANAKH